MRVISTVLLALTIGATVADVMASEDSPASAAYESPYRVRLPWPDDELIPDLLDGQRGDPQFSATIAPAEWYGPRVGPWGPRPRAYPPPAIAQDKSDEWQRARLVATALRLVGYTYRHHHLPDWDPPPGWRTPKPGEVAHDGKGVDCSNFTAFVFNQGLGITISSDVQKQAATQTAALNGSGRSFAVATIAQQDTAAQWAQVLKPGDLLYIRPRHSDSIAHVVIWIGTWGTSGEGDPLVLDSHGADVRDENGKLIPAGVQLRPFRANSWYATRADHALRLIGQ